ncbi:uncharacterized protein [Physcomitrium patens]|uniref:uncharacterized protein n=1 Tax=Physcomitrium patens TaxID=3218 RepID=UPI003CCE511E
MWMVDADPSIQQLHSVIGLSVMADRCTDFCSTSPHSNAYNLELGGIFLSIFAVLKVGEVSRCLVFVGFCCHSYYNDDDAAGDCWWLGAFLLQVSVIVVDAKRACTGATGAGQGYVWLKHRNPAGKTWRLLHRSKLLWEQLVADLVAMLGFFCSAAFARGQDNRDKGKRRRSSRSRHGRRTCRRSISKSRSG